MFLNFNPRGCSSGQSSHSAESSPPHSRWPSARTPAPNDSSFGHSAGQFRSESFSSLLVAEVDLWSAKWNQSSAIAAITSGERDLVPPRPENEKGKEFEKYTSTRALYYAAYKTYLLARHGWLTALEEIMSGQAGRELVSRLGIEPDISRARGLVEKDLRTFLISPDQLQSRFSLADYDSQAKVAGLYFAHLLLERNNPEIASVAESSLGVDNHRGASYFDRHPEVFKEQLVKFAAAIDSLHRDSDFMRTAVTFAQEAFLRLGRWEMLVESEALDYADHRPASDSRTGWKGLLEPLRLLKSRLFSRP